MNDEELEVEHVPAGMWTLNTAYHIQLNVPDTSILDRLWFMLAFLFTGKAVLRPRRTKESL